MNLRSDKDKAFFIHLPKNGGHTICPLLLGTNNWQRLGMPMRSNKINKDILEEYYIFTTVRNPYDRFLSGWKNVIFKTSNFKTDKINPEFFAKNYKLPSNNLNNIHVHLSQTEHMGYVHDYVNDFFRFEDFDETYRVINDKFNCGGIYPPPHKLKSSVTTKTSDYLNDEIISYINEKYDLDFKNFGYEKL